MTTHLTDSQLRLKSKIEELFGIDDLFTKSRLPKYIDARMFFCEYLRTVDRLSLTETAKVFGRNVPAMCHYQRRFDSVMQFDRFMQDLWNELINYEIYLDNHELKQRVRELDKINSLIESLNDKSKTDELIGKIEILIKGYNG
jgi:hypothetical protein